MKTEYSAYMRMLCACYRDIVSAYPAQDEVEFRRDHETLVSRFSEEGLSFLTKTLPSLAKAIDTALANGTVLQVPSFARKKGSKLPRFLGWLIGLVFSASGEERADACPFALKHLRQLLYLFYKLEMPYDDSTTSRVIEGFKSTDAKLLEPWHISGSDGSAIIHSAANLVSRVLSGLCPLDITPKHGPGSVATGESSPEKPYFRRDYKEITRLYPLDSFYYLNANHMSERLTIDGLMTADDQGMLHPWIPMEYSTAKVVLVPKDSRGPRLISMEPLEVQWIQQGQCERLVKRLESHWLTAGHINFKNQDINRYLAWKSSMSNVSDPKPWVPARAGLKDPPPCAKPISDDLVTLDMKDASDCVSVQLVATLFPRNWTEALMASRSSHTELPSGEVIALNKFAPMGSAVCFPIEAFCFWAIALSSVMLARSEPLAIARKRVWVYGDDIICHKEDYLMIKQSLEMVGLKLNSSKCCTARFFRESCGLDAYKGVVVTPLRISQCVSRHWPGQTLMAYVAYSNAAHADGYDELAHEIENLVQSQVKVPYTTAPSLGVQFVRPFADVRTLNKKRGVRMRFNSSTYNLEAYGPTPRAVLSKGHKVTWESYFIRSFRNLDSSDAPPPGRKQQLLTQTLQPDQYSVPRRVSSKRGWTRVTM